MGGNANRETGNDGGVLMTARLLLRQALEEASGLSDGPSMQATHDRCPPLRTRSSVHDHICTASLGQCTTWEAFSGDVLHDSRLRRPNAHT